MEIIEARSLSINQAGVAVNDRAVWMGVKCFDDPFGLIELQFVIRLQPGNTDGLGRRPKVPRLGRRGDSDNFQLTVNQ
jgi:hypothetical protein